MSKNDKRHAIAPRMRFPEFIDSEGWARVTVADTVKTVTPPKKLKTSQYAKAGPYPVIDQSADASCGWTDDEEAIIRKPLPMIVFGDHTCIIKKVDTPFAQGADGIKILVGCNGFDTDFLYQLLCSRPLKSESYKRHFSKLKLVEVPRPPSPGEQRKIAECLGSLDDLIAAESRKLAALRDHKKGLMQQLFPREGETRPRLRFPEFRDAGEWSRSSCADIATVKQGYGFPDRFQGGRTGKYPFYKVSDISQAVERGQQHISDANNYIDDEVLTELSARPVPFGTIIFAKIGEAIRSNRRVVTTKPAVIDNNVAGIKATKGKVSDDFLYYLWSTVSLIDHAGGVVPAVTKSALESVPLTYPSRPEEQQRIADCLASLDTTTAAQAERLEALRTHKRGLMQQLFPSPEHHE